MTNNSIPKIVFQTWKSKTDLPENYAYWSNTFRKHNPDYTFRLWDDKDNRAFIAKNFPWFLATYDAYPSEIYRADAVRYFFLYLYGGVYADMDTECLRPLNDMMNVEADVILGRMGTNPHFEHSIPNAIMLSSPRQEFWLLVISLLVNPVIQHNRPEYTTGPVILKIAHDLYTTEYREDTVQNRLANIRSKLTEKQEASRERTNIGVLPGFVMYPIDWNDKVHDTFLRQPMVEKQQILSEEDVKKLFPSSVMVTYWTHSWKDQIQP